MTNRERLNAMSDYEFANWLCSNVEQYTAGPWINIRDALLDHTGVYLVKYCGDAITLSYICINSRYNTVIDMLGKHAEYWAEVNM